MLNGVNLSEDINNSKLNSQLGGVSGVVTNPINNPYKNLDKSLLIDETAISKEAINLYQKEQDIQRFSALVMSDPEDMSHEQIVSGLFEKGVKDIFSDETIEELSQNNKLLEDISF